MTIDLDSDFLNLSIVVNLESVIIILYLLL